MPTHCVLGGRYVARKIPSLVKFRKVVFGLSVISLFLFFLLHYLGHSKESLISVYVFIFFWGIEKCLSWKLGYKIGIGPMVAIPSNADRKLRLLGLVWGLLFLSIGVFNLFKVVAT
jgi:hypothetical protein